MLMMPKETTVADRTRSKAFASAEATSTQSRIRPTIPFRPAISPLAPWRASLAPRQQNIP
jgi:hypothetical protein